MSIKGNQRSFRGDIWFNRKIDQRVRLALREKEAAFFQEHSHDTDRQLLEYVQYCAQELGHTPNVGELIGGSFIEKRFGRWETVIAAAGLPRPHNMPPLAERLIYKLEYKEQSKLFSKERMAAKEAGSELQQQRVKVAKQEQEERLAQDLIWGKAHEADSDEELLAYLRQCTDELGRSPVMKDVVGGSYIAKRFGSWPLVLTLAEIPLPKGMLPPKLRQLDDYRHKKKASKDD